MNGKFVISLDFELHWGIFDVKEVKDYKTNLVNTRDAISKILDLSKAYDVRLTFATVGFLFSKTKEELKKFIPDVKPSYSYRKFDPYRIIDSIGENEDEDPFHYAQNIVKKIASNKNHEIGTHTFCHYYCLAEGQNATEFNADLEAAKNIAKSLNININSIVFPRNQVVESYLKVCANNGITSYRGNENTWVFIPKKMGQLAKALRLLDSYINIFGHHTYSIKELTKTASSCLNIPSSRFLRPYSKKLKVFETFKLRRIKNAMTHAAKNNELYHLWWHPHNFGSDLDKNISTLHSIYKHYKKLHKEYGFESETMTSLTNKVLIKNKMSL
ncbi:polysaccharide deacetylase family protein [Hwangdonia sp.]|uniref:polysaccharide deacetylase family protein n=1 Tax=Hwangdonia sp. TaxID=1883432 RepID=UPI003AB8213F